MTMPGFMSNSIAHNTGQPGPAPNGPQTPPAGNGQTPPAGGEGGAQPATGAYDPKKPLFGPPAAPAKGGNETPPNGTQAAAQPPKPNSQEAVTALRNYVNTKQYNFGEMKPEVTQALTQAGFPQEAVKAFQDMFTAGIRDAQHQIMLDMIRHVDDVSARTREAAVGDASQHLVNTQVIQQMEEALPYAKEPNVSPLARTVLGKFLSQGMSPEKAIQATGEYFGSIGNAAITHNGGRIIPKSQSGAPAAGMGLMDIMDNHGGTGEKTLWADILGGQR